MKHLSVLVDSDLVVVRRRGRERWNHINAVPLRELSDRWTRWQESQWADRLSQLGARAEDGDRVAEPAGVLVIEQRIRIAATSERVWSALVDEPAAWWGAPYLHAPDRARSLELDARLGGYFVERWDEGGAIWARVGALRRPHLLRLDGPLGMPGAVHGVVRFELHEVAGATVLELSHRATGEIDDDVRRDWRKGWEELLSERLVAWVERGEALGLASGGRR